MAYQWIPPANTSYGAGSFGDPNNTGDWRSEALQLQANQLPQDLKLANLAADTARLPALLQQDRFNSVFPFLENQIGNSNFGYSVGGQSPPSPEITVGGIWNPQQTQQQVNASRAQGDQSTATNIRTMNRNLGSSGFGANSPLAKALAAQYQGQNLAQNTSNTNQLRWNAAEGNAQHLLSTQQAREQQFASRQQEDIARRQQMYGYQSGLIAALAGLV